MVHRRISLWSSPFGVRSLEFALWSSPSSSVPLKWSTGEYRFGVRPLEFALQQCSAEMVHRRISLWSSPFGVRPLEFTLQQCSAEMVHRRISLWSSPLFLQQCSAYLVRLISRWVIGGCFVGFCLQDLFNTASRILVYLPSRFFLRSLLRKRLRFILSDRSDFHITVSLLIAVHAFGNKME